MLFGSIGINIQIGIGNDFIKIIHIISNGFIIFMANVWKFLYYLSNFEQRKSLIQFNNTMQIDELFSV